MDIILTHEQADFDAAASVLAAWLLTPQSIAILPKRMNRNIAAFVGDYKEELPFHFWDEVPNHKVDTILMTDTQTYNVNNRFTKQTIISVIDHHQPRLNLPEDWKCIFERTGACTTIIVEQIMGTNIIPEKIQASLLLMGIYEDTGFLSYGSTTPRDAYAAAWLLENGADLDLLHKYLNTPLTEEQQEICDLLLQSCESLQISGQHIIIAAADVRGINDEYSTVAHHLRDMLSPDALVILLSTKAGIRLIGRATNDRIDIGKLMKRYNGGGHSRAAAGLIIVEDKEQLPALLEKAKDELISILPDYITPPLAVSQIMSSKPLLINAGMSVKDAVAVVRRYGYEGYPVINSQGNVVGLLNSRAVERARTYHLDLPVEMVAESGSYSVLASDSIEDLKQVMNHSGWGQIPVISDEDKRVIGIVTRTDLIKTLSGKNSVPGNRNLSLELKRVLPASSLALINAVAKVAYSCHYPIYIVGGFVRDLLLEQAVMDFDIVVEGDAIHLARTLVNIHGGKIRTHPQFGTAKWMIGDIRSKLIHDIADGNTSDLPESLDLISARTEFYDYPTALPKVERSSIKLDLHRRDFTINTMAIRLDGTNYGDLLDFWGGFNDLKRHLIRVLHSLSFTDDPTRMLRAVRFEQRFGFEIEPHTLKLLKNTEDLLKQVSGRRILHEFNLFFHEGNPEAGLRRLNDLGILTQVHPEIHWDAACSRNWRSFFEYRAEDYWKEFIPDHLDFVYDDGKFCVWWGTYSRQVIDEISKRLQLSQKTTKVLTGMSQMNQRFAAIKEKWPSEINTFLESIPVGAIYCYYCLHQDETTHYVITEFMTNWQNIQPVTTGNSLKALGYPPGAWIAQVLKRLRAGWIDGEISSRADEEKTLAHILPIYTKDVRKTEEE